MLLKELDFSQYNYKRISVTDDASTTHFPPAAEDKIKELLGEHEVEEITPGEDGRWLYIKIK